MDRDSIAVISQEASYERNSRQKNVGLIVTLSLAFFIIAFTFIWYYYEVTEVTVIQKKISKKWLWKDGMEGILFFLC